MKVYVNRKPKRNQPWGGGNLFTCALVDHLVASGFEVTPTLDDDVGIIFMLDPRPNEHSVGMNEISLHKALHPGTRVIQRVNECDARKGTIGLDDLLRTASALADTTVFVSNWMAKYHISRGWRCGSTRVIFNGVDLDHFAPANRQVGPIKLVTHHWSDNPMKGQLVYEFLDDFVSRNDDYTFSYIGRTAANLKHSTVIKPLHGAALGTVLAANDVYVSGTRFDPGPNHIIEALACGLPTYAPVYGGGAAEFAGEKHTYDTIETLEKILLSKSFSKNDGLRVHDWDACVEQYYAVMLEAI